MCAVCTLQLHKLWPDQSGERAVDGLLEGVVTQRRDGVRPGLVLFHHGGGSGPYTASGSLYKSSIIIQGPELPT